MIPTLTKQQAIAAGYAPLTTGYYQHEDRMMDNVIRDMQGIDACLVPIPTHGTEVWRKGKLTVKQFLAGTYYKYKHYE